MEFTNEAEGSKAPVSSASSRRRLTLGDVMVLVASSALSLFLLRIAVGLDLFTIDPKSLPGRQFIEHLSVGGGCVLVPLTLAVLIMSWLDRLTPRRELIRGAGFVVCVAVCLSAILPIFYFAIRVGMANEVDRPIALAVNFNNFFGRLIDWAGPMIVGAWLSLALTNRKLIGPSPIDRLGCLIGFGFILIHLYPKLFYLLLPLFSR